MMVKISSCCRCWVAPGIKTGPTSRQVDGHHDGDGSAVPVSAFTRLFARALRLTRIGGRAQEAVSSLPRLNAFARRAGQKPSVAAAPPRGLVFGLSGGLPRSSATSVEPARTTVGTETGGSGRAVPDRAESRRCHDSQS